MRISSLLLTLTAAATLTACGAPGEVPLGPEHAGTAGSALAATAEGTMDFYAFEPYKDAGAGTFLMEDGAAEQPKRPFAKALGMPEPQPATAAECQTVVGNPDDDPDQDGIPTDLRVEHDCVATEGDVTFELTGALYIRDTLPAEANPWNFEAGQEDMRLAATAPNYSASIEENWSVAASQSGSLFALDTAASVAASETRPNQSAEFSVSQDLDTSLDVSSGDVTMSGAWSVRASNGEETGVADSTIDTDPSIHYDANCAHHIDDGAIEATYAGPEGEAVLRVEWTGCDQYTIYYNGTQVDEGPTS